MADQIRIFLSFPNEMAGGDYALRAGGYLRQWFEVYDYRQRPQVSPDLFKSLQKEIKTYDVFFAVLDKDYLSKRVPRDELEIAVELCTGDKYGSLKSDQRSRPLVYILTRDQKAASWLSTNHPGFTGLKIEDFGLQLAGPGLWSPDNVAAWEGWRQDVEERLRGITTAQEGGRGAPTRLVVLGRPNQTFTTLVDGARAQLVSELNDMGAVVVRDGWFDTPRAPEVAGAVRGVVQGAPSSLLIQPCDQEIYADNTLKDGELGGDLRTKLRQIPEGLGPDEASAGLNRTLFWVPRVAGIEGVGGLDQDAPVGDRPLAARAEAGELAEWVRARVGGQALAIKAEQGIDDLAPALWQCLKDYFGRLDLSLVDLSVFADSVQGAARDGMPLLIAIHDRIAAVGDTRQLRQEISKRAAAFDKMIDQALAGTPGLRVARAILQVRYAAELPELAIVGPNTWYLLPIEKKNNYAPPPERLLRIAEALNLPVVQAR